MGLDISLYDGDTEVASMNWLRNPFGLCQWAEDNANPGIDFSLWYVCNEWAYDKGEQVNRQLFKSVVSAYGERVNALTFGHFWWPDWDRAMRNFASGNLPAPSCPDNGLGWSLAHPTDHPLVLSDHRGIGVPQEWWTVPYRAHPLRWAWDTSLDRYKAWFGELVAFADLLQDERYRFYCSN